MSDGVLATTDLAGPSRETSTDPLDVGAARLAALIAARKLSATEVVDAFIARIEEVNPSLNALVLPRFEEARREARAADEALARRGPIGVLHGVPVTIKEEFRVAGMATTLGLPSRTGDRAVDEGPLVRRLRDAGAIILGKTNLSQLLIFNEADNPVYRRSSNPWNLDRTPGGSSGGEAAIMAARGSPLGLGGDLGGSLRVPAHFCGIHTLKPTSRRLTKLDGVSGLASAQEGVVPQPGPLARHVADLALAMKVLAAPGLERVDASVPPVPWPADEVAPSGLRVGYFVDDGHFPASPAIRRLVEEAATALGAAGAPVRPWKPPSASEAIRLFVALISADRFETLRRVASSDPIDRRVGGLFTLAGIPRALRPLVAGLAGLAGQRRLATTIRSGGALSAAEYFDVLAQRNEFRARFFAAMDAGEVDVLVCPPHALPALTHGASEFLFEAASYSVLFNVLGMPAGVVAAGRVRAAEESDRAESRDMVERSARRVEAGSAGLPLGVQVAARPWREDLVLSTMTLLEAHFRRTPDYPLAPSAAISLGHSS